MTNEWKTQQCNLNLDQKAVKRLKKLVIYLMRTDICVCPFLCTVVNVSHAKILFTFKTAFIEKIKYTYIFVYIYHNIN